MKAQNILFQMRYGSLLCSKRLQSDRPKCRGHLVEASPTQKATKCANFDVAVSKCSRFNNWPIFSKSITDLVHFRPYQTLCYFVAFWVLLASTKWPLHFGMVLSHCLEESKLPYLIWKGIFRAFIWPHLLKYLLVKKPSSGHFIRLSLGALVNLSHSLFSASLLS